MMNKDFLEALNIYDAISNDSEKLRATVRYFFAKYPEEAKNSLNISASAPKDDGRVRYLNGYPILPEDIRKMRELAVNNKIAAIKYCRDLRAPIFTLKEAKEFVEQYCM